MLLLYFYLSTLLFIYFGMLSSFCIAFMLGRMSFLVIRCVLCVGIVCVRVIACVLWVSCGVWLVMPMLSEDRPTCLHKPSKPAWTCPRYPCTHRQPSPNFQSSPYTPNTSHSISLSNYPYSSYQPLYTFSVSMSITLSSIISVTIIHEFVHFDGLARIFWGSAMIGVRKGSLFVRWVWFVIVLRIGFGIRVSFVLAVRLIVGFLALLYWIMCLVGNSSTNYWVSASCCQPTP